MQADKLKQYIDGLNDPQRQAVLATSGPALVIAGAGSGKTRVLTLRIAHLIAQGAKPYNILALTFTNKAAREMKERIAAIVGPDVAKDIWMGTFHSVFAKILRIEAPRLGLSPNFTIYDTADSKSLIKNILKTLGVKDDKAYTPAAVLSAISAAKNDLVLPADYASNARCANADKAAGRDRLPEIYRLYVEECRKANALDFDDLLLYTNILLRDAPDALEKYQDKFHHILVDEYQDTNLSQYVIINRLAKKNHNICVVGDDAQSIYSFRGARIENILNFRNDYPESKVFKLEQNYRSTQNIVGAANKLIAHNVGQIRKNVFSDGDEGDKVAVWPCGTDRIEAGKVVADIVMRIRTEHLSPSHFAILYRSNAQSRVLEDELRRAGVPYKVYAGQAFYQRAEIKDVLAYLRLTVNPADVESLRRVINTPKRQIGDTTVAKVEAYARAAGITVWDAISNPQHLMRSGVSAATQTRISRFVAVIELLAQQADNLDAYPFAVETLSQSGLLQDLNARKTEPDGQDRFANVQELLNGIKDYDESQVELGESPDIRGYLQQVSLITDQDDDDDSEKVALMTIHSSKGLEFDSVYLVGVEDEIIPGERSADSPSAIEEERRLMYVAITRAKRTCVVSYATERFRYGKTAPSRPSRFIAELDPEFCDKPRESRPNQGSGFGAFRFGGRPYANSRGSSTFDGRPFPSFDGRPIPIPRQQSGAIPRPTTGTPATQPPPGFKSLGVRPANQPEQKLERTPDGKYSVGSRVLHDRFGAGRVIAITGSDHNDVKLRILFDNNNEEKTLLLKFARIKPI